MLNNVLMLAGLAYASYTDLKSTIIPDKLNYGLIVLGFLYHIHLSITMQTIAPLLLSIAGAVIAFAFSYFLWRIGAWAGGDVKLFTALGALTPGTTLPIFPFIILINAVLLSFPFVMLYIFIKTLTQKRLHKIFKKMLVKGLEQGLLLGAFSAGFFYLLPVLNLQQYLSLPLLIIAFLLPRYFCYALALLIGIPALLNFDALPFFSGSILITLFWQAISYGKQHALRQKVTISKLKEGMIAAETLYLSRGKIKTFVPPLKQKLTLFEPKHTIVSMYKAAGLEKKDIAKLKKHKVKSIWIKEGIPLVPIIFFGALSAVLFGNLILLLFEYL